jgi:UDP-N-acetylglucosamine acyltransferase
VNEINENAKIGKNCKFGTNVIIGPNVSIGDNNTFGNNVVITGNVLVGNNNYFSDFISIGRPTQHRTKKFEFKEQQLGTIKIGNDNIFREFVTIHSPVNVSTILENNCFLMAYVHIPHDAHISEDVTIVNNCQIGGHTFIGKSSYLALSCTIHPRTTIGAFCRIGMQSTINSDIPPGMIAHGSPIRSKGLDVKFMKEKGFSDSEIDEIKIFYKNNVTKEDLLKNSSDLSSTIFKNHVQDFLNHSTRRISFPSL